MRTIKKTKAIRDIRKENFNNDKVLKSIRKLFRLEKDTGINDKALKDTRIFYGLKNKKSINDKVLRDIRTLYESDKEDYYKPIGIPNAFSSNHIEYESNGNKDKILFIDNCLDMIRQYLSDIINDHKTQGEWKIQLTMAINFISSKDSDSDSYYAYEK